MKRNGWSQQVPADFGKAVGQPGPHNSQISQLQNARLDPKAGFWLCLAEFNRAVAEQDLSLITDRGLRDRLQGAEAFLLDDGIPAKATDFFGMFVGQLPIPHAYQSQAPVLTPKEVEAANDRLAKLFLDGTRSRGLEPDKAMAKLWTQISIATKDRPRLKKVLAGWDAYTAEELEDGYLMASLEAWANRGFMQ